MQQIAVPLEGAWKAEAQTKPPEIKQDWMKQKQLATPIEEPAFDSPLAAASSALATAIRAEIIRVGRKLWERQYVDGNGARTICCARPLWSVRPISSRPISASPI
jgi:hypothetical protein